jgi:predicted outer membrane repeat protein
MRVMGKFAALLTVLGSALALAACATAPHQAGTASAPRAQGQPWPSARDLRPVARASRPASPARSAAVGGHQASAATVSAPGNPSGDATVPATGQPVNTSHPTHVIGNGTPASCTSAAVVAAVAEGGIITFSCGQAPVTITMDATAKVVNTSAEVVLDGGGKVTLSGGGVRRILYMDTCDPAQHWTTSHCQDQPEPQLTVQNLAFADGNSTGQVYDGGGGGAIFDRGGQLKIINSSFTGNRCDPAGPDLGGAAIRALSQYDNLPVYVVHSTFHDGSCSNGGALSSIGVSWQVLNSVMTGNQATGWGANPASSGSPGGGSGAAIYTDGDQYTVTVAGTLIEGNTAREGGGAIFFVSDDNTGTLTIQDSTLHDNPSQGFQTPGYPGIFFHSTGHPTVTDSTLS